MSNGLDYINIIKKVSPYNLKKGILYLRHYGPKGFWIKLTERFQKTDIDYKEWLQEHKPSEKELEKQKNVMHGVLLIVMGIALQALSYGISGSNVKDFISGLLLGLSIAEMLVGVYVVGKSMSGR